MKRNLRTVALAVFTFLGFATFGQSLNFKGGYTTSFIKGGGFGVGESSGSSNGGTYTSKYEIKNMSGYNMSIGYEFRLGNRLSLETGLKHQTRGFKVKYAYSEMSVWGSYDENEESTLKMNFVDLPIVLNTAILTGDFRVYCRTGIYAGYMTSMKYSGKSEYKSSDGEYEINEYSEKIRGSEIDGRITGGLLLGVGAEYKGLYLEANYNVGALALIDFADDEVYNHDISLSLGYKLKFKK